MTVKTKLREMVGPENFSDDPEVLNIYSKDFSLALAGVPNYVVKPKTAQEVQKVIQFANKICYPWCRLARWCTFTGLPSPSRAV